MKILLLFVSFNLFAVEPKYLISGYGKYKQVTTPDFKTPKKLKVVFDVYSSNDDFEEVNRGINTVARFLNMHFDAGIKPKNMHTALVIHGAAGKDILKNLAYNKRNIVDNPNTELLKLLYDNGVQINCLWTNCSL